MHQLSTQLYDIWNEEKKGIQSKKNIPIFHIYEREIWYVKLWINIWFEQNGKTHFRRPVLIIKKIGNMFYCIPLTTKGKENSFFYYKLQSKNFEINSWLILSQTKNLDKKRFDEYVWKIDPWEFLIIKKLLKEMYLSGV